MQLSNVSNIEIQTPQIISLHSFFLWIFAKLTVATKNSPNCPFDTLPVLKFDKLKGSRWDGFFDTRGGASSPHPHRPCVPLIPVIIGGRGDSKPDLRNSPTPRKFFDPPPLNWPKSTVFKKKILKIH